ncbi:MAG: TatD family hydrolase [Candidatus Aenigmarchaeota archaeon]|nr:TatD family hydrolase [Candidatus Aenigmarchaeota archaeon]
MIDVHAHLEQMDFDNDRYQVIEGCKQKLKAVITCCAHPEDFDLTMQMVEKHKGFVFATVGIHPIYIKEITEKEKDEFLDLIKENKDKITALGEQGLDYFEIKESEWQQKQKELFIEFIDLSKELNFPLVVHSRDAFEDAIRILEQEDAKQVLMHMFGAHHLLKRVIENNWFISLNTIILRSKKHKKIARDMPSEKILTETDSPWLDPAGGRNTPLNVKIVIEKISEIKKVTFEEMDKITTNNAIKFFNLKI